MYFRKNSLIKLSAIFAVLSQSSVLASEEEINTEVDWFNEILQGGNTSIALLTLFSAGCYFTIERFLSLRKKYIVPGDLSAEVAPLWSQGDFNKIIEVCQACPSTLSRMITYIVSHRHADPGLLIPGAQDIASRELKTQSQKSFSLAVVAALAPLLGLLGTMIGMIESFKLVEVYGDEGGASMLAGSISKALITTAVGLIIAIPSLAIYHFLKFRINSLSEDLEERLEFLVNSWLLTNNKIENSSNITNAFSSDNCEVKNYNTEEEGSGAESFSNYKTNNHLG